jgi:hypothetical protein
MTDITEYLRGKKINCNCYAASSSECCCDDAGWPEDYCNAAADEIERLRAENETLNHLALPIKNYEGEIERLRKERTDYKNLWAGMIQEYGPYKQALIESQAREAKLREALKHIAVEDCGCGAPCDCYSWDVLANKARDALSTPDDALRN